MLFAIIAPYSVAKTKKMRIIEREKKDPPVKQSTPIVRCEFMELIENIAIIMPAENSIQQTQIN